MANYNLNAFRQCHRSHQYRCLVRNCLYYRNRSVPKGGRAYSLSKDQLEEANRGPNHEVADRSPDSYSTKYDSEGNEEMQHIMAPMPSLTALPLAPTFPQPPANGGGAGVQGPQPPITPMDTFVSTVRPGPLVWRQDATVGLPPTFEVVQVPAELDMVMSPKTGALMPRIDMVAYGTGLLNFSMDQLHAALDTRPQMFETATDKEKKEEVKKEEKKEKEEDECTHGNVALDGQGQDSDEDEEKGGDPSLTE